MILIVGLGNPGKKFKDTRHNLGFQAIDFFVEKNNFPDLKLAKKFRAEISEGVLYDQKIILSKPQTFMNLSGEAVKNLINFYQDKKTGQKLIIIHDEIDLPFGKIRISKNRGSAGHKGVESIIKNIKNKNFIRIRIGIQPRTGKPKRVENFVLKKSNKEEEKIIIEKTASALETIIKEGLEKAMNEYN